MGEVITYLVEHSHPLNDIYNTYTIDQLWLFYEKSIIIKRKQQYEETIAFAHCVPLALGGKEAAKGLNDFLKSLLPEEFRKAVYQADRQEKLKKARPDRLLQKLGIPTMNAQPNVSSPPQEELPKIKHKNQRRQKLTPQEARELLNKNSPNIEDED